MKRQQRKQPYSTGFTLIELMIVVVIIAILAAIAYPSYTRWVVETRRSDAHVALSQLANELQKFYSECSIYTNNITDPRSCATPALGSDDMSSGGHYQLSVALTATGYTITATPLDAQAQQDTDCAALTLTHTGVTGATGSNPIDCWRQ